MLYRAYTEKLRASGYDVKKHYLSALALTSSPAYLMCISRNSLVPMVPTLLSSLYNIQSTS